MIARDRELLAWAASVNKGFGLAVGEMMFNQRDGELPSDGLREMAVRLDELVIALLARASELDHKGEPYVG